MVMGFDIEIYSFFFLIASIRVENLSPSNGCGAQTGELLFFSVRDCVNDCHF